MHVPNILEASVGPTQKELEETRSAALGQTVFVQSVQDGEVVTAADKLRNSFTTIITVAYTAKTDDNSTLITEQITADR